MIKRFSSSGDRPFVHSPPSSNFFFRRLTIGSLALLQSLSSLALTQIFDGTQYQAGRHKAGEIFSCCWRIAHWSGVWWGLGVAAMLVACTRATNRPIGSLRFKLAHHRPIRKLGRGHCSRCHYHHCQKSPRNCFSLNFEVTLYTPPLSCGP